MERFPIKALATTNVTVHKIVQITDSMPPNVLETCYFINLFLISSFASSFIVQHLPSLAVDLSYVTEINLMFLAHTKPSTFL